MLIKHIDLTVAVREDQYPTNGLLEIAFVGRSNVGKSSLINTLLGKKMAKVSQAPGKTRTINFYNIDDKLNLVDLPGYGYARVPKAEIEKWGKMIEGYLERRQELQAIALLLDIRHEPTENDVMMYQYLQHHGHEIIIIATKLDKIKRSQIQKHLAMLKKKIDPANKALRVLTFSSLDKVGMEAMWDLALTLCTPREA